MAKSIEETRKELRILNFIYRVLNDKRNTNRYWSTRVGNIDEYDKMITYSDCIKYIEEKYKNIVDSTEAGD